jgi:hypothetical protein
MCEWNEDKSMETKENSEASRLIPIDGQVFCPKQFLKSRHPELYSDSQQTEELFLTRNQFDYHLETITNRKDEIRFENFCRSLAKKELCPNLIPQTGPTGGGDSKVDSETFPVSSQLATLWYIGDPERASKERWAFAFSAQKSWESKVKSDVKKIVEVDRQYSLICFITNQYVPDKRRAKVEDRLTKEFGIQVRIYDRTWIIQAVFENRRWEVVWATLDVGEQKPKVVRGPVDTQRELDLAKIEKELADTSAYKGPQYVEDCLETAVLARGLNLPRTEVAGRFDRAERECAKYGTELQLLRILYQRAWTAYWWFEDYQALCQGYVRAERLAIHSDSPWILEKLVNLCQIGSSWARANHNTEELTSWSSNIDKVKASLEKCLAEQTKSTAALWAQTQILFLDLLVDYSPETASTLFHRFKDILEKAKNSLDYPIDSVAQIIEEIGHYATDNKAYDVLFESMLTIRNKRAGECIDGQSRLRRGFQLLNAGKRYEAIVYLAKAQNLLAKEEQHYSFVSALAGTAVAYRSCGLLWAARANLIVAADRALHRYLKSGDVPPPDVVSLIQELIWTELQLGRPTCVFTWLEFLMLLQRLSNLTDEQVEEHILTDQMLSILVLRSRFADLSHLTKIPAKLKELGLIASRGILLFLLGHEDVFRQELQLGALDLDDCVNCCLQQPAASQIASTADWLIDCAGLISTHILGCKIELSFDNLQSILIGEMILGFLEAFLSTAITLPGFIAARSQLRIQLKKCDSENVEFSCKVEEDDCGETTVLVNHSGQLGSEHKSDIDEFLNLKLLPQIVAELHLGSLKKHLEQLWAEHEAHIRGHWSAWSLMSSFNLVGCSPKYFLDSWFEGNPEEYELARSQQWNGQHNGCNSEQNEHSGQSEQKRVFITKDSNDRAVYNFEHLKHSDLMVQSPINLPLWDRARWKALGFIHTLDDKSMNYLLLAFGNEDAGKKIFRGWKKRIGDVDTAEWLGITIITGIDRKRPYSYRVVIGINECLLEERSRDSGLIFMANRIMDMDPADDANLKRFKQQFERIGWYDFAPAKHTSGLEPPDPAENLSIRKMQLRFLPTWQIDSSNALCGSLGGITDPYIPPEVKNPPITEALKHYRYQMREAKRRYEL